MSKEIYISTTPHETRLAIVEDEQLAEIYYERENEYTLAGSIYNGKVTRVLPGMQSSFVDIGLERDAFLYVTDFMEEAGDAADFETDGGGSRRSQPRAEASEGGERAPREGRERSEGRERGERGDRGRGRRGDRDRNRGEQQPAAALAETRSTQSFDEPVAPAPSEAVGGDEGEGEERGSRRWRGRRGRRRGRGSREEGSAASDGSTVQVSEDGESVVVEGGYTGDFEASESSIEIDLTAEPAAPQDAYAPPGDRGPREDRGGRDRSRGGRGRNRDRGGRGGRDRDRAPREDRPTFDNSYAGYYDDSAPEVTDGPVVLPGEKVRKYRDPAEVAAEEAEAARNAPPKPEVLVVSAPEIEIVGWDGGAVLPGETLGRHRNRAPQASAPRNAAPVQPVGSAPVFAEPIAEVETPAMSPAAEEAAATADLGALPGDVPSSEEFVATVDVAGMPAAPEVLEPAEPTEYEPTEGESASVSDTSRRDLRRLEQQPEKAEEAVAETPDATTYDLKDEEPAAVESAAVDEAIAAAPAEPLATAEQAEDVAAPIVERSEAAEPEFTTMQATGEMLSVPAEPEGTLQPLPVQDEVEPATPVSHEGAVQQVTLAEAETTPVAVEIAEEEYVAEPGDESTVAEIHAYGDGDFHEEEIDETDSDEYDLDASLSGDSDEVDEYEEETLDGSDDMAATLHESLESTTGDDFEETEEADASGGYTEADFGGEPEEDEASEESTTSSGESRQRGDRGRRGSRDRRGGRNSGGGGDRGRGRRPSMQTTDLPAINELLKPGQEILVQIAKEPIAKKGARITSHIALPGRFLVFMPTVNHTGVSRKISSDEERRRLKSILLSEKGDAQGGFIVRTAADGASEEELRTDLRFLIQMWNDIKLRSESSKSPALIYHDLNLVERILRDQVTDNFSAIWVDTEQEYERVLRFLQRFQPSLVRRVKLYTKETPLFEHFGVTAEIDKALKSKVWLKSGGSIVINQTEALVAIDINTGKYVGKTARLEDTILKTNLDAIPEIVRQIRLRDLGGIIVIDFIDMDERKNRAKVLQALEDEMRTDRAPSKILPFNDFGLVIMTRKRVKQSLERTLCIPDPVTEGTGMIKSPVTVANEIYIEMRKMHRHLEKQDVLLRVHPEVVKTLKANGAKRLQELEDMTRKTILVKSDPSLSPEQFDIH